MRVDGRDVSITRGTKKEAEQAAMLAKCTAKQEADHPQKITLEAAYKRYIDMKDGVLSPSTIAGYKRLSQHTFQKLMPLSLERLTAELIQKEISAMSKLGRSPKYIANANGLLSAVLRAFYPSFSYRVSLPMKKRKERIEPKESDITGIAEAVKGKSVELPTLLAMWMGLRMSEILGLTWDCIDGDIMHIKQAKVDEGIKRTTKTENSDRYIRIPPYIKTLIDARPHTSDFIIPVTRGAIYDSFQKYTQRAGIQHYRFHDLRHLNTTVQLLLGIDNKAIIKRNGWSTDAMIKMVYGHTSDERKDLAADVIDDYFSSKIGNKMATENSNSPQTL